MRSLRALFGRASRPAPIDLKNGDAFAACAERFGITAREAEIIRLLLEGRDSRRIGESLFISDHTVKNHIHNIYQKLDVQNRIQLVRCFQSALTDPSRLPADASPAGGSRVLHWAALPAAVLFLGLSAGLIAWKPWGSRPRPAAFPPVPALAVLDFENLSGDPELDKWEMGLPLLLATDLGQSKRIRTVSDDVVYGALQKYGLTGRSRYTREEYRRLAKEIKADYLIDGTVMKAGGGIVVTAFLQNARSGVTIRTDKLDCKDERDLLQQADGLARLVREGVTRTAAQVRDDIDLDIEVLTTSSALAYKYYSEGWRYHRTGDYEQSLIMLGKAVELDPEFAMAYRMMSVDARNLRYIDREADYMRKAFELSAKLPEDCRERHLIRADYYAGSEATWELAIAEFKKVLENHPDDLVANNNLGILCYEIEDFESAVRYADVPVSQGTSNPFPHHTKAVSLRALGRTREAVEALEDYHKNYPANRLIYQTLIATLLDSGDLAGAEAALDKAVSVFPDPSWSNWKGVALFNTRGAAAAREEFRMLFLMEEPAWHLRARLRLILLALAQGRYTEAEKECREGAQLAESIGESTWAKDFRGMLGQVLFEQGKTEAALAAVLPTVETASKDDSRTRTRLYVLGQIYARTGDLAAVADLTRRLQVLAGSGAPRPLVRESNLFTGIVEFERGRYREAVAALEKSAASLPTGRPPATFEPLIFLYLGLAREKAGDPAGAVAAFDKILEAANDRLYFGDTYPMAVFGKARAEEALGRGAAAADGYRTFLGLWADADAGRPETSEARSRLASLTGSAAPVR